MKRINFALLFDTFFAALCAFLLFFTAIRYYTHNRAAALIFGIAAALLFGTLAFLYIRKKRNKKLLTAREEKNKKLLSLHLSLIPESGVRKIFTQLLNAETDGKNLTDENAVYFLNFCLKPLSQDDIAGVIKFESEKEKIILCNAVSPEAKELADNFLIGIKAIDELYPLIKEKQLLPEKFVFDGKANPNFFKKVRARFNRKLCAPLFWCGFSLIIFSFFTFFSLYYIIMGGLLLIISAVCLVFGKKP